MTSRHVAGGFGRGEEEHVYTIEITKGEKLNISWPDFVSVPQVWKQRRKVAALLQEALNAYFGVFWREKLHNYLKLRTPLSYSSCPTSWYWIWLQFQPGSFFQASTSIFSQLRLGVHKPCVPLGPSNSFFCIRLSRFTSNLDTLSMWWVALFPCGTSTFLYISRPTSHSVRLPSRSMLRMERDELKQCVCPYLSFAQTLCSTAHLLYSCHILYF